MRLAKVVLALFVVLGVGLLGARGIAANPDHSSGVGAGPLAVSVEKTGDGSYVYMVDGKPQFLVGMGYNAIYRHLSREERAARYDADFAALRAAGVNTIMGWDADKGYEQDKFDMLTLDKAWEHGLGVVMPFYLPPGGDYADRVYREQMKEALVAKVSTYKDHPAIRMWGIGNEVIEPLINREEDGLLQVFGQFYLELADAARAEDPNHPVIYREAEEVFLPHATWYGAPDGVERPWLLFGMNSYTLRLEDTLADWAWEVYELPLFITEFSPADWDRADRSNGFLAMWQIIRSYPQFVLGAAPYVWTTEGPEPVDAFFGLVDQYGNPVDGSFAALAEVFRDVESETTLFTSAETKTPISTPTATATATPTADSSSASLTFAADADAYVEAANPSTNYGASDQLLVDGLPNRQAYLRFVVTGVAGVVQSAKLWLNASNGTSNGPAVYSTANGWAEMEITWNNKPSAQMQSDNKVSIGVNDWVEFDVTSLVAAGDGTYSFVLIPDSNNGVTFYSHTSAVPPRLVVIFDDGVTATPTATQTPTPTDTPTYTPTETPTSMATETMTPTMTPKAATRTPTWTDTYTPIVSPTSSFTVKSINTPLTATPTSTYIFPDDIFVTFVRPPGAMAGAVPSANPSAAPVDGSRSDPTGDSSWLEDFLEVGFRFLSFLGLG